ncbi:MAG: DUF2391 family protein [Anaerolineales bacterium]|jgi:uncharacterized membrane protein
MNRPTGNKDIRFQRVAGRLHRIVPILDAAGKVIHYAVSPLRVELRRRDVMQILVGSSVLAVPIAFTEETWRLGSSLPMRNVVILAGLSILFISAYVYFNFYRELLRQHLFDYIKRVLAIYLLSLIVVGTLLTIIEMAPWREDLLLAVKRTIIVGFPSSMSAAVSDAID